MRFEKLRIVGFKTFVDPTELAFRPGLTGIVGPNGCGKSNLVEALRWVMGETSHKSMRASAMDDVIFSGSAGRPARNTAEVGLMLADVPGGAGLARQDGEVLEVTRRIAREDGSVYRINGREARARDVQLLFADAASGARSPSLVRQGQIGEIIAARPQARRRILEDAAGVAGLHSRRHEAELRLKAAEDNLVRLDDVLRHIEAQVAALGRQARQATDYRAIAARMRRTEAQLVHLSLVEARDQVEAAGRQFDADTRAVAEALRAQGEAARAEAVADHALGPLRDAEARAAAGRQRLDLAARELDDEQRRAARRASELDGRLAELQRDVDRGRQAIDDADRTAAALANEGGQVRADAAAIAAETPAAAARHAAAGRALEVAERTLAEAQTALSELAARRAAAGAALRELRERLSRADDQFLRAETALEALGSSGPDPAPLRSVHEDALAAAAAAETAVLAAEAAHAAARDVEVALRPRLVEAERAFQRFDSEARTLRKLLDRGTADLWPSVLDRITAAKGYEIALAVALGDDLDASVEVTAPVHWAMTGDGSTDPPLPPGVDSLARHVDAPPALGRRLRQVGVVQAGEGVTLRRLLQPGQRLVTLDGGLWRWDGLTAAAEAPSPAARRLAEKNRLDEVLGATAAAEAELGLVRTAMQAATAASRAAAVAESEARQTAREAARRVSVARDAVVEAERRRSQDDARRAALTESRERLGVERDEARLALAGAEAQLAGLAQPDRLSTAVAECRAEVAACRAEATEAQATLQTLARRADAGEQRLAAIAADAAAWADRKARAVQQTAEIEARIDGVRRERSELDEAPAAFEAKRRALAGEREAAERALRSASDAFASAETVFAGAAKAARLANEKLAVSREARVRGEATLEAARARLDDLTRSATDTLEASIDEITALAAFEPGKPLPGIRATEETLLRLRREREALGAVNLRADAELAEAEAARDGLVAERRDLEEAIRKLRRGIQSLNDEGRQRLLASFDVVNGHFRRLFSTLFDGGEADLHLVESDDPLEAGLEIIARPPGKRPQVLTLLSGGEQALTASALIFAVFLTNPSPVCVLDEIDAPLDDHNVERLCTLLAQMVRETDTRFIVITHNPITMSKMDRLFGVTMAEQGVSQVVSVDLADATRLAETA